MFINPKTAIEKGWITGIVDPKKQIQPNAIDFTLDSIYHIDGKYRAYVGEDQKMMRPFVGMHPVVDPNTFLKGWILEKGQVYDGTSNVYVNVPEDVAAIIYTRSTLARNGVFLMSGLYDTGYKGQIGFTVYPISGDIMIAPGTRVGQIAFIAAQHATLYAGGYNHEQGTHWTNPEQAKSVAKSLEEMHRIAIDHTGQPAGKKTFI